MRVPPWARWAVAVVAVLGIAAAGVAANMAVLDSTNSDTRLGTLSAKSLAVASGQAPPVRVVTDDDDDDEGDDRREDDSDDD